MRSASWSFSSLRPRLRVQQALPEPCAASLTLLPLHQVFDEDKSGTIEFKVVPLPLPLGLAANGPSADARPRRSTGVYLCSERHLARTTG